MSSRAFNGVLYGEPAQALAEVRSALSALPADVTQALASAGQQQLAPGWVEELQKGPQFSPLQRKIVTAGAKSYVLPNGISSVTGRGSKPQLPREFEFGTLNREEFITYRRRSSRGITHSVTRRTKRQLPTRSQTGWIAYPAAARWSDRVFQMYLQIIVKFSHDAFEAGKK